MILSMIPGDGAAFHVVQEDGDTVNVEPVVAWALTADGEIVPMVFCEDTRSVRPAPELYGDDQDVSLFIPGMNRYKQSEHVCENCVAEGLEGLEGLANGEHDH